MNYGTPFTETEALLAAGEGTAAELDGILADMLPGELQKLERDANRLARAAYWAYRKKLARG